MDKVKEAIRNIVQLQAIEAGERGEFGMRNWDDSTEQLWIEKQLDTLQAWTGVEEGDEREGWKRRVGDVALLLATATLLDDDEDVAADNIGTLQEMMKEALAELGKFE